MNATNIIFAKCCRFDTDPSFCTPINRHIDTTSAAVCTTTSTLASIFIIRLFSANHNSIIIIRVAHGNVGIGRNRIITVLMVTNVGQAPAFGLSLRLHPIWNNVLPTCVTRIQNTLFIALRIRRGTLSNRHLIRLLNAISIATGARSLIIV